MGNFSSFNISPFSGDSAENFDQNLQILSRQTEIPTDNFIFPFQTHDDKIQLIDSKFLLLGSEEKAEALKGIDALITAEPDICIGVTTADCVPLLLFDCKQKVIAAVHAGWRGTIKQITAKAIQKMQEEFGTRPENCFAYVGTCIDEKNFEVGIEVADEFKPDF